MHVCRVCKVEYSELEGNFYIRDRKAGKYRTDCINCTCKRVKNRDDAKREVKQEYRKEHYRQNKGRYQELRRQHYENNRAEYVRQAREREGRLKVQQTPVWANKAAIKAFYDHAALMSKITGHPYHVDHIIPLNGATVCGLHVETNLRVVPATVNLSKSNLLTLEAC